MLVFSVLSSSLEARLLKEEGSCRRTASCRHPRNAEGKGKKGPVSAGCAKHCTSWTAASAPEVGEQQWCQWCSLGAAALCSTACGHTNCLLCFAHCQNYSSSRHHWAESNSCNMPRAALSTGVRLRYCYETSEWSSQLGPNISSPVLNGKGAEGIFGEWWTVQ